MGIVPVPVERYLSAINQVSAPETAAVAELGEDSTWRGGTHVEALLPVLLIAVGATRALGIGMPPGAATVRAAAALPADGMLINLEADPRRAAAARAQSEAAGLASRITVVAADPQRMLVKVKGPFDLIYQAGPPRALCSRLDRLVALLRPGGLLVSDNVLAHGAVIPGFIADPAPDAADTQAMARYNEQLNAHPALATMTLPLGAGVSLSCKRRPDR